MPNDCSCTVRLSAKEETINMLVDKKFSFKALFPPPKDLASEATLDWQVENWGTKWDCYNFKIEHQGKTGLQVKFTTAWDPPYAFFYNLMKKYSDIWLRCDWIEEGGNAGVLVGYINDDGIYVKEMNWKDWCLEDFYYHFRE